jgi:hypothetical protein
MMINAGRIPPGDTDLAKALSPVVEVRRIMHEIMVKALGTADWTEYLVALTMCALRATLWETMPLPSRRLMFLVAGMTLHELREKPDHPGSETPSPEETEVNSSERSSSF